VRPEVSGVTQATTFPQSHDAYRMRAKCGYKVSCRFVKPLSLGQQLTVVLLDRATLFARSSLLLHRRPAVASHLQGERLCFRHPGNRTTELIRWRG
jgi:hypothetical protein